jgi:hypothetical protein
VILNIDSTFLIDFSAFGSYRIFRSNLLGFVRCIECDFVPNGR